MKSNMKRLPPITTLELDVKDVLVVWQATKELLGTDISGTQREGIAKIHFALDEAYGFIIKDVKSNGAYSD